MAYVLELSNHKTTQHNHNDDDINNRSNIDFNNDSHNDNDNMNRKSNSKTYNDFNNNHSDLTGTMNSNNPLNRGPFFDVSASKNVTALVGRNANLNCRIKNLGNKTVRIYLNPY